jgi:16S rRNA processing protein RimM
METPGLIAVGQITRPHGVGGEVRVLPLTDFPERFDQLAEVRVGQDENQITTLKVASRRWHNQWLLLKFEEMDTRDQVLALSGNYLFVPGDQTHPLPPGRYYFYQLLGLKVLDEKGQEIGEITHITQGGANDVYHVRGKDREILIPAIKSVVQEIDLPAGIMRVTLLPGLLE